MRLTHWINALSIALLLPAGLALWFREEIGLSRPLAGTLTDIHAAIGFLFAASLFARLAYMLAGPEGPGHWRDILPRDAGRLREMIATLRFYLSGFRGEPPLYFAHNALAGLAYAGFFALGIWQVATGSAMYLLGPGMKVAQAHPAHAATGTGWPPEWLMNLHLAGALLIGAFVLAHLTMLVVHELLEARGLASSMISGRKFFTDDELARLKEESR